MKFGVSMFQTPYAIWPAALAVAAEERGFESLFFPEHTHIPCSRKTPFPRGGELPKEYIHSMDPFVALATAVEVTKTIRLGLGVCLVIERDPITLAKEVSSLDFLSGGRVILGAGGGWNVEEMANHGTDFRTRWKLLREREDRAEEERPDAESHLRSVEEEKPDLPEQPLRREQDVRHRLRNLVEAPGSGRERDVVGAPGLVEPQRAKQVAAGAEKRSERDDREERDPAEPPRLVDHGSRRPACTWARDELRGEFSEAAARSDRGAAAPSPALRAGP
jgi:hypothetical protein